VAETLLLVAAGGLAREVLAAVRTHGRFDVVGFLDDAPELQGTTIDGVPVLGPVDAVATRPEPLVLVCAGHGLARERLVARLDALGVSPQRYATFVHPAAEVSDGCEVGAGSIVLAGVVMTAAVVLGEHVVVMPNVTLTHDDVLQDFSTVCAGVALGGAVVVGRGAYLGMGSSVRERTLVGAGATLGMGAVLVHDLPQGQTWAGIPARPLHTADEQRVTDR
jgi:sugar O-acyltransferase (sialic acid O-acetyltransferase NeuD family)